MSHATANRVLISRKTSEIAWYSSLSPRRFSPQSARCPKTLEKTRWFVSCMRSNSPAMRFSLGRQRLPRMRPSTLEFMCRSHKASSRVPCSRPHSGGTAPAHPVAHRFAALDTYRPAMRGRAREALRSIGQENLTSPRIPRTASLGYRRKGADLTGSYTSKDPMQSRRNSGSLTIGLHSFRMR